MINARFNKLMNVDQEKNKEAMKQRSCLMIRIMTVYYLINNGIIQIRETKGHLESDDVFRRSLPLVQWVFWIVLVILMIISKIKNDQNKYQLVMGHVL